MQLRGQALSVPARPVKRDGKAVRFIPYGLYQVKNGRELVENNGLVFLSVNIDPLVPFRDRSQRL